MKHKKIIKIFLIAFLVIAILFFVYSIFPQRKIALGVWTEGLYDAKTQKLHPEKLLAFEKMTNKKFAIAHYYRGWESFTDPNLISEFETLRNHGWEPMLNANPYYFSQCPVTNLSLYEAIAAGKCDDFLHKAGRNLSRVNNSFYLLFAWEMNNNDLEWGVSRTGSKPIDFVRAWRHMHDIFQKENVKNIIWVFCPNIPNVPEMPYSVLYPGDEYVDWICLDGYNWGTTQSWSQWSNFKGVFSSAYKSLVRLAPDKPMMIAEVNTTDKGGDKAEWYKDMFTKQIPFNFPQVKAVVIYNEDRSKQENVNWRVDVSKESLDAFISGIHLYYYE